MLTNLWRTVLSSLIVVQMDCLAHEASHGTQVASVAAGDASFFSNRPW